MIEITLMNYLTSKLSCDVKTETPIDPPSEFVRIEVIGGSVTDWIRSSTIAIQSNADTLSKASHLNEDVIDAMLHIAESEEVYECNLQSSYNYTNQQEKKYRYQAIFNVYY